MSVLHAEMDLGIANRASSVETTNNESCRQRLLAVLAQDVPDTAFCWRRRATNEQDAILAGQRQENAVEEMRRRMEQMCGSSRSETPVCENVEAPRTWCHATNLMADCHGSPENDSISQPTTTVGARSTGTPSTPSTPPNVATPQGRRRQFLSALSQGLRDVELPVRKGSHEAPGLGLFNAAPVSRSPSPATKNCNGCPVEKCAEEAAKDTASGADFFAELNALQERLAQRKVGSDSRKGSDIKSSSSSHQPQPGGPPLPTGTSPRNNPCARRTSATPDCDPEASVETPRSSGASPLRVSESRKPRSKGSSLNYGNNVRGATDDELLNNCNDDLLRWADEVLRKAQQDQAGASPQAADGVAPQPPSASNSSSSAEAKKGSSKRPPMSPGAGARLRRAEELRNEMRRLNQESEFECERLACEEAAMRRRLAAEQTAWKDRMDNAAEQLRNNVSKASNWAFNQPNGNGARRRASPAFGSEGASKYGAGQGPSSRAGSLPPPLRPPPAATPRSQETHEAAWGRLEAQLETGNSAIRFIDIPWPSSAGCITGVTPSDTAPMAKRKLVGALRRWHPDKWRRILDRVPENERERVMERVKGVAQRLLEEKAKLTGPGGVLH